MRQTILRSILNRNLAKQKEQYVYLQRQNFELQQRLKRLEKYLQQKVLQQKVLPQHCNDACFYSPPKGI